MPLANNSTGAGAGDNYNSSNPAMVTGILSPTDGDVYVYGYDDNRKQVIIRKVTKSAQVPHKGMTAHPVYTNNLLSTYVKNAVVPTTVGATHTRQAVLPTVNDYLSTYVKNAVIPVAGKSGEIGSDGKYVTNRTLALRAERISANFKPVGALHGVTKDMLGGYQKNAVTPTVNEFLSTYQKIPVRPTVIDFLSTYVKNPVTPTINTFLATYIKYAVNPVAGANTRESFEQQDPRTGVNKTYSNLLPLTMQRLNALKDNPVTGSFTHALHGRAGAGSRESFSQVNSSTGTTTTYNNLLSPTIRRLTALRDNPVTGSHTHNLHGRAGIGGLGGFTFASGKFKTNHTKLIEDIRAGASFRPMGALHGKAGAGGLGGFTFTNGKFKTDRTKQIEDARLTMKPFGALYGRAGIGGSIVNGRFETTKTTQFRELRKSALFKPAGALHGVAGSMQARYTWENPNRFKQQLKNMSGNTKTGALHGKAAPGGATGGIMNALKSVLGFGGSNWPIAKFHFYVMIGGTELGFQAVEGLEAAIGVIEYRDGNSPFFGKEKMPGMVTYEKVTLKKGMFTNDTNANSWFKEISQDRNYTKRRTIVIALMDNTLVPQFIWRYEQCFLTKVVPSNLDAESENEVAIEELEFVGRAWYLETLAGVAAGAVGALAGSAGISLSF